MFRTNLSRDAEPAVMATLEGALQDPDWRLCHAALFAIAYAGWSELEDAVRRARTDDASEAVRATAVGLLEGYEVEGR